MTQFQVVLVTCSSRREAKKIALALVNARLAACVNILSAPIESIYRWKSRTQSAKEFLLIIKSSRRRFAALSREIKRLHTYEVPEIIALTIDAGSPIYLKWVAESVSRRPPR